MERYEQYIGKILNGKYEIRELIGIGGMAYVFKATVAGSDDVVSIKILNDESNGDEKAVKRFVNESKAVSMLCHKNIVGIYDVAFHSDINYIAMEYVDGITLKEYIDYKKTLDWGEAVYYISQILRALGHAHSMGIIHRDVKPQNIMITRDGTIKVTDFGIAKMLNSESITMTDKAIGTVDYISPEQASGKTVGFYSDIYSVGVMLYEMTTGTLPFVAESPMAVAMMQVQNEPEPPSEINPSLPRGLEQIILKAMNKEPDERFSSCAAMGKALSLLVKEPSTVFAEHIAPAKKKQKKNTDKKRSSSFLPIIAGVTISFFLAAAVTAAGVGIKFYETQFSDTGEDIRIPNLVGKQYTEELQAQLRDDSFEITVEYSKYDPEKAVGEIVGQFPEGGGTRKLSNPNSSCAITVEVNAEPGKIVIDDYSNSEARVVRMQLTKLGLVAETVTRKDNAVIEGYVISTEPAPGTTVEAGSTVTLYVSSGAAIETTRVPEIIGLDVEDAKRALQTKNISVGEITYEDSAEPANTVISASYEEGEIIPKRITDVDLIVSRGNLVPEVPEPDHEAQEPTDGEIADAEIGESETESDVTPEPTDTPENSDEQQTPETDGSSETDSTQSGSAEVQQTPDEQAQQPTPDSDNTVPAVDETPSEV